VQLQTLAEATNGRSAGMAQGVLCFFYDICYEDKIEEEDEGEIPPKSIMVESENTGITQSYELSVYPNPTQSEMTVALNNSPIKILKMEVLDIYGKCVSLQTVNDFYTSLKMNKLVKCVYVLKVWLDNGEVVI
jgi:hypothetical protein